MYEGRRDEHASAEVSRQEEELVGYWHAWKAFDNDGKRARFSGTNQHSCTASGRRDMYVPAVLSTSIRTRAKTCSGVL